MNTKKKLSFLRQLMKDNKVDAYIIPSSDPHQSEYLADHWKIREWMSGFTGSSGTLVVTQTEAGLWTDSRYFLQAKQQLSRSGIKLQKLTIPHTPQHIDWLAEHLPKGATIGFDGLLYAPGQVRQMAKRFYEKDIHINSDLDLIPPIWEKRPALPQAEIFELEVKYAGDNRQKKLKAIRKAMKKQGVDFHLVSTLDDIAWIFNIRGKDVDFNPVAMAKILVDYNRINISLYNELPKKQIVEGRCISTALKAMKNATEIKNIKTAMRKDGVALTRLFRWLESTLKKRVVSEVEVAEQLNEFRAAQGDYFGESFPAIVGYQANGAIVHYRPEKGKCAGLAPHGILLLDSGGQYLQGTTDITRTVALGKVTASQKKNFTLVLKGNIALSSARFLKGTRGNQLEVLARQYLWQEGLNYGHGTGHGVGYFLNVHEGPQAFGGGATAKANTPIELGMLTSNEPGFYLTNAYGIRIENLELTVFDQKTDFGEFYKFETVTLFPIDRRLIDKKWLSPNEITWLNDYHEKVLQVLSPHLDKRERAWMERQCKPL